MTVKAGGGNDIINFKKSKYKNTLYGEAGDDKIYGGTGNDKIYGGKGKDTINAGKGNNTIYFNKGDGKDTILNGGGVDTLVFAKETKKTLKAKISGKNIVLTGKKGKNTVTLKNFMNGNHSAQYVTIGKKKVKVETLIPVKSITNSSTSIKGSNLRDKITSTADNAVINSLSGDDTINIYGADFNINPGKGDDVINIFPESEVINPKPPRTGTITINKGDGSNTINGISNLYIDEIHLYNEFALTVKGDGLLRNFHGINYITGNISGNNLILNGASGEKLTITDFMLVSPMVQDSILGFYVPEYQDTVSLEGLFRLEGPTVEIKANKTTFISQDNTLAATADNGKHTVHINSSHNTVVFENGENNVGVAGEYNQLSFSPGTKNGLTIAGDGQNLMFGINTINKITVTGNGDNSFDFYNNNNNITTSSEGHSNIWFYSEDTNKANIVNSRGKDEIVSYGALNITFSGNFHKDIEIRNNDAKTEIHGVTNTKNTELYYTDYTDTKDIMFSHYYNNSANSGQDGADYITLHAKDANGNILKCDSTIWGSWSGSSFDLESLTKDKLVIEYYDDGFVKLGFAEKDLTQYIDMTKIYQTGNPGYIFEDPNMGELYNIAKNYFIQGTSGADTYSDYGFTGTYTINDNSGNNTLVFNTYTNDIRCLFDVDSNGNLGDLYFVETGNFESFIKDGPEGDNYLCLKDALKTATTVSFGISTGDSQGTFSLGDFEYFVNENVKEDIVTWLTNNDYTSVMEAIADGKGDSTLYSYYSINDSDWSNYWNA